MKKGFISYSGEDFEYCRLFFDGIKAHARGLAIDLWLDSHIPIGGKWHETIQNRILNSDFAILLMSSTFFTSKYIKENEWDLFWKLMFTTNNFKCFPVKISPCDTSIWPDLNSIQRFAPRGKDYGMPNLRFITYADLVEFTKFGELIRNPNIERFHMNFVKAITFSFSQD